MSRLDSFIRRLEAQRAVLGAAIAAVRECPGYILEVGLGNGRTFDHLRELAEDREIFAFDRAANAHPDCLPDAAHLVLGEFAETLGRFAAAHPQQAALVHCDTGSGDKAASLRQAAWVADALRPAFAAGGVLASDQPVNASWLVPVAVPAVPEGRYQLYRVAAGSSVTTTGA